MMMDKSKKVEQVAAHIICIFVAREIAIDDD